MVPVAIRGSAELRLPGDHDSVAVRGMYERIAVVPAIAGQREGEREKMRVQLEAGRLFVRDVEQRCATFC